MAQEHAAGNALEELARQYGKPGEPNYHNNMGSAHRARGETDAAIAEYREAVRLHPSYEVYHCNLAIALAEKGAHEEALQEYHEALRLNPRDYHSHFSLGNLLGKLERVEEAAAEYNLAIESDPERPEAHFNLANLYWDQSRVTEAASHYEKALAGNLDPHTAAGAHFRLGALCTDTKEWEKAEKHLLTALEQRPDDFLTHYSLALVYLNTDWGEQNWAARSKALIFAQKALELDPKDEDARQVAAEALAAYEKEKPPESTEPRQSAAGRRPWWQFWKK
jgi:tetratricopeptide (TPR) repeat protein